MPRVLVLLLPLPSSISSVVFYTEEVFFEFSFSFSFSPISTFLLSLTFFCFKTSISLTLFFLNSTNSFYIFIYISNIPAILAKYGIASLAPVILLLVDTIKISFYKKYLDFMVNVKMFF